MTSPIDKFADNVDKTFNAIPFLTSDDLIEKLGNDFYELKRMVAGGFCAYSTEERAIGQTAKESLEKLLKLINDRKNKGTVA